MECLLVAVTVRTLVVGVVSVPCGTCSKLSLAFVPAPVQGAATVRKLLPGVVSVFLVAESEAQLVARLVSRKTEQMDKMMTRVQTARWGRLRERCRYTCA